MDASLRKINNEESLDRPRGGTTAFSALRALNETISDIVVVVTNCNLTGARSDIEKQVSFQTNIENKDKVPGNNTQSETAQPLTWERGQKRKKSGPRLG